MSDKDFPELMTPSQVAAAFKVDPKTITRWAAAGKLTAIRTLGGHRRYRRGDIKALIAGDLAASSGLLDAAMHSVWQHGHWRNLTTQMSTDEREAAAAAVIRHDHMLNLAAGTGAPLSAEALERLRWWRHA